MTLVGRDVGAVRGGEPVFFGLEFEIAEGQALVVTGPNGAGKSTLLRIIAELLPLAEGQILLRGRPKDAPEGFADRPLREHCHYLGHENAMKPGLSVEENLSFWQQMDDQPHLEIDEALDMVGLASLGHVPFGHLSTGQKRRIAIARLLIVCRPIWLLDEPTAGLDKASESQFADLMKAHMEDGGIIIAATHMPLGLEKSKSLALTGRRGVAS